ncbi:MAG: hypothetical protein QGG69_05950 [Kiritimatiellia bacterium]|jgi:hypothetical protein|nr:hypothetical protein [Kiritimatiellia bacterium]MDP6810292.1 hypothetical protein [Kiritimatiellia bacterium]
MYQTTHNGWMKRHVVMLSVGCTSAIVVFFVGVSRIQPPQGRHEALDMMDIDEVVMPLRQAPSSFPRGTYRPNRRESEVSGAIDLGTFSPGRDLTYVEDDRAWWESDNDSGDTECDHTVHHSLRLPLETTIQLVAERGGVLKVQDSYRPHLVHNPKSLHKEGRAIDLTCNELPLEELAKICWQAGFDWVYHEKGSRNNGPHIHASVAR